MADVLKAAKAEEVRVKQEIAEKELREKVIPFIVRRKLPNGESEDWRVKDLIDPGHW